MIALLLTFLIVVPTLFLVPYFPYIIVVLTICYFISRIRKGRNLRSIRKLAEKKGEENEIEINIKKENETNFIEKTAIILFFILLSFIVSSLILHFSMNLSPSAERVLSLTMILCLCTVIYMYSISPFHEDKKKRETHYKNFCKGYMDERYQEFLREEKEREREEGKR